MLLPVAVLLAGLACGCDEPGCARPELAADPRFATNLQRVDAREALIPIISGVTSVLERRVVVMLVSFAFFACLFVLLFS